MNMHDPWLARLSEYIDGDLSPVEARACEQHVTECDVCRSTLAELRDVLHAATMLEDELPSNDLWAGIAARIGATTLPASGEFRPASQNARRFTFSGSQLAAAAMLLMTLTGAAVWYATNGRNADVTAGIAQGTIIQTSGASDDRQLVSAEVKTDPVISENVAQLERTLEQNRAQLDPATVEVVERSIEAIDRAIEDATNALLVDPGNPYLSRQLDNTMRKKLDILQRATTRRAGT